MAAQSALAVTATNAAAAEPSSRAGLLTATGTGQGPAEAKNEAAARLMSRLQDRRIEILSERTDDSTTWANPDGSLTVEAFSGPVRVKDEGGDWRDIDTTLVDTGDEVAPKAAAAEVVISDGGSGTLASLERGKQSFSMGWSKSLPAPTLKGDTATYALGGGADLKIQALPQGFEQSVLLTERPSEPVSYRIPLDLKGLKLEKADNGHLRLEDSDGKIVAEASAPSMWGSDKNKASGEPAHVAEVDTAIEQDSDGASVLVLKPDEKFLSDPDVTYPVTVDPVSTLAASTDTWVATNYPDSQRGSTELKAGTYDAGTTVARSYVKFDVARFKGKHIIDTNLALYSYYASTCQTTGAGVQVRRITADWDPDTVTWGAQPATTATDAKTSTAALGYDSSCPAGTMNFDVDGIAQAWADGSANHGLQVRGADEDDSRTWRRFRSANHASGDEASEPHLTVTYNSYGTGSALAVSPSALNAYNGSRYVTSLTPLLSAKVSDTDGGTVKAQFEVTPNPNYNDAGAYSYTGTSAGVASGGTAKLTVPSASAFPAGSHLQARIRAYDGTDYGPWSGHTNFTLNTGKPVAPSISCTPYEKDAWTAKADGGAQCTLDTSSTDGQGYYWGLDNVAAPNRIDDTTNGTGGDPLTITIKPEDGWHTLYAKTVDSGGNLSAATTDYTFGVGGAALLTPEAGERSNATVRLSSRGNSGHTGVTYQYRHGETDSWNDVPAADVTKAADGSPVSAWPVGVSSSTSPSLTWDITKTLSEGGPVEVRAKFTGGTTVYSSPNTITVDRWGGADLSEDISPGGVNAVTGDHTLSSSDAKAFGMASSRTAASRRPDAGKDQEGQAPIYGSQWTSGLTIERSSTSWSFIRKTSATSVEIVRADGEAIGFTAAASGDWVVEPGSESLALSGSFTGNFTLKHTSGSTTKFTKVASDAPTWQMTSASMPTDNSTTTIVWEKVTSGEKTLARPKYLIGPTTAASAATCEANPSTKGCRVLEYVYASTTTATASSLGEVAGQVKQIKLWATTPGAGMGTATALSQYTYDEDGRLREQWDPRTSPALKTAYTYTSTGRVATLTPPGELAWTFTYGQVGSKAPSGPGMLLSVSRPALKAGSSTETDGSAVTNVVYNVALNGTHAPHDMAASDVAKWGQTDNPAGATAVFPADASAKAPASNDGNDAATGDFTRASVTYYSTSGRSVNTQEPGGHISTTEYDEYGNIIRELSAANRELALSASGDRLEQLTVLGIDGLSMAERAQQLSSLFVYSGNGQTLLHEYGPLHNVSLQSALKAGSSGTDLAPGTLVAARQHVTREYDEGRPTDGSAVVAQQVTTTVTSGYVDGYPAGADPRTTKTVYDWSKGLPTKDISDPASKNVTHTTGYDNQGRTTSERDPLSTGSDAGTTVHQYWTATGTGTCEGRPEWADLECSVGPAVASAGSTLSTEYDRWGNVAKTVTSGGDQTRSTTTEVDEAGRTIKSTVTGNGDQAVPAVTTTYDDATGKSATIKSADGTIASTYDKLGRLIRYDDGTGNVTTTEYDSLGRQTKVTDSAPSTRIYAYDTAKDPRGLATSVTDSAAGNISATYNPDGAVDTEKLPGDVTLRVERDPVGNEVTRIYTTSTGVVALADNADVNVHDQNAVRSQTKGSTATARYTFDGLGLSATAHTGNWRQCRDYTYTYNSNSNLTKLTSAPESCAVFDTSTSEVTTHTYDSGGRLTDTGYAYDDLGRTTAQPGGLALKYYANGSIYQTGTADRRQVMKYDAAQRTATSQAETYSGSAWNGGEQTTYHYGCDCESPSWERGSSTTRHVNGLQESVVAETGSQGGTILQLTDLDGNAVVQLPLDETQAPIVDTGAGDDPQASAYSANGVANIVSIGYESKVGSLPITVCNMGHKIEGSGKKIKYQRGKFGCGPLPDLGLGFCNWRMEWHYADTYGKSYRWDRGSTHNQCATKGIRETFTDKNLKHYGKACAQFWSGGKRRGVQCHSITR
ncbi:DNRLRE domain-containing protein [Streptomyces sp. ISL-98]|uniref:DNRLRE domain-containing protein n=1 Tax=Streptomyces sp. ISL-98 TaxID=2819192 RepID=UPI001BE6A3E0|nr:DNRLRE domain-containing protein [Streptomyces sp. ISL-98]MBT2508624.1 DNRLRE domain-containing protein [Streptomyces sp. ISL-98]